MKAKRGGLAMSRTTNSPTKKRNISDGDGDSRVISSVCELPPTNLRDVPFFLLFHETHVDKYENKIATFR